MTEDELKGILENGIIVFDTNVLLNLYFYTVETKNKMIAVMEKYKERLWMPYQVGWEFFNNRENRIETLHESCDKIKAKITEAKNSFASLLNNNFKRHPYIVREKLIEKFNKGLEEVEKELQDLKSKDPDYATKDAVWEKLTNLYDGRVGEDYSLDRLEKIYSEGEKRYALEIPPGYCDIKDKKDRGYRHLYGDLIIWKMVIEHSKVEARNVVFVTEEKKPDWYDKKKQLPRKDLMCEFCKDSGGQKVLICDQERFLRLVEKYLGEAVDDKAIEEIKDVAKEEEQRKREESIKRRRRLSMAIDKEYSSVFGSSIWNSLEGRRHLWNAGMRLDGSVFGSSGFGQSYIPLSDLSPETRAIIEGLDEHSLETKVYPSEAFEIIEGYTPDVLISKTPIIDPESKTTTKDKKKI